MDNSQNIQNSQIHEVNNNNKRKFTSPPEKNINHHKKHKDEMDAAQFTAFQQALQQSLEAINTKLSSIEHGQKSIEQKFDSLSADFLKHKHETQDNLNVMQTQINELKDSQNQMEGLNNRIEQDELKQNITCTGIPAKYHNKVDELIDSLNRAFALSLDKKSFLSIFTIPHKTNKKICTLKMKFRDMKDKFTLLDAVASHSRDVSGNWDPLLVEDLFEEFKNPLNELCGTRIGFFNALTNVNQSLLRMKHEVKPFLIQERDGRITMRRDKHNRRYQVNSVAEVRHLVHKLKNNQN